MRGYEVVRRLLAAAGVETVFQYMSEDTMGLIVELETNGDDRFTVVSARHEQGATAMADAYARAGDRIGVCVVGRGPAVAQTGTALLHARKNGSSLLLVVPESARDDRHDHKAFEQESYLRSTVGTVATVRSARTLAPAVAEALHRLRNGEGPIAVQVAKDVLDGPVDAAEPEELTAAGEAASERPPTRPRLEPDRDAVDEAVELYLDSDAFQHPVVVAGAGAVDSGARDAIAALAERLGAVLLTTLQSQDYFGDHPFAPGFPGSWGSPLASELLAEASYVLAIGCSLNRHTVDDGRLLDADATVVHVDVDPGRIGLYVPVDLGIVGDARRTADALREALEREGIHRADELWTDRLRERIAEYSPLDGRAYPEREDRLDERAVVRRLASVLPDARLVGSDGGQFRKWAFHGLSTPPEDTIMSCDTGAIGLGVPLGVGLGQYLEDRRRSGDDERVAITLCGDAGFMMSLQELETAARHEIPVVVVVGNNSSLGSEYHQLEARGWPPELARLSTPSLAAVAEALGAEGYAARTLDEVDAVADRLQEPDGPVVLECITDPDVRYHGY